MTPQGGVPTEADTRFPAWAIDAVLAAAIADDLLAALLFAVVPLRLVRRFRDWAKRAYPGSRPNADETAAWLTSSERADPGIAPAIGRAFANAYASGWLVGRDTAEIQLGRLDAPEWDFLTSDPARAREILHERGDRGAAQFFGDGRSYMRRAVIGRIDVLARALTETADVASRDSVDHVRDQLFDRNWAQGLSQTEVTRAVSAATLDSYRRDRVPAKGWMTALDQKVCPLCRDNELAGPIGLDEEFPSGDTHPPGHPGGCRCGLIPAYRDRQ